MGIIDQLTNTHTAIDVALAQLGELIAALPISPDHTRAVRLIGRQLRHVGQMVERHIANESALARRAERVLGPGALDGILAYHRRMGRAIERLFATLVIPESDRMILAEFHRLCLHFERYTQTEIEFLQANGALLFPSTSD